MKIRRLVYFNNIRQISRVLNILPPDVELFEAQIIENNSNLISLYLVHDTFPENNAPTLIKGTIPAHGMVKEKEDGKLTVYLGDGIVYHEN